MRKWEDIVKDKMEEPEGALPESVFAEFRARREAATAAPTQKRFPLVWAVVPAVAAGLAAVLLLHKPSVPEGDIQIIQQPSAPVAVVTDTVQVGEPEQAPPLIALAVTPKLLRPSAGKPHLMNEEENVEAAEENVPESMEEEMPDSPIVTTTSPFIPESAIVGPVRMKVGPAAGMIAGGGLLAAVITPLLGARTKMGNAPTSYSDNTGATVPMTLDNPQKDDQIVKAVHYFPLKVGLSARFPISERFSVTTGIDYSWYKSSFTYSVSGEKIQHAHYLGIPVRLDWTFASSKWLDVYLGAGFEGEYCLGATFAGEHIAKDGFSASLLGVGGIQFKITPILGVYIEPELSWTFIPRDPVLESYRTKNPLMFSVSSGLRITIGK